MAGYIRQGAAAVEVYPTLAKGWDSRISAQVNTPALSRAGDAAGSRLASGFQRGASRTATVVKGITLAGATALGGLATAGLTAGLKTAAGMETAKIAFSTMLGSGKQAEAFLTKLGAFAAKTPFEFPELQTAAQSLISVGIGADKVIPIMTSLGNATAGMGTGAEGVKRATVALQQMTAAQRISAEDLNQLRDAGIPVYELLAKATGKSTVAVAELAAKGKLGKQELDQLMAALASGKGLERFAGMMDAQSQSLTGLSATLKDTFNNTMAKAIEPAIPLLKDGLGKAIEYTAAALPYLRSGVQWLVGQAPKAFASLKGLTAGGGQWGKALDSIRAASARFLDGLRDLGPTISQVLDQIRTGGSQMISSLRDMGPIATQVGRGFQFVGDHADLVAKALPYLAGAFVTLKAAQAANQVVGRNSVIGFGAQLVSTAALTVANFALSRSQNAVAASAKSMMVAQRAATASENVGILAKIRAVAASVAQKVAELAAAAAKQVSAAAQWLLNAAMTANPIGIIIVAIVALVAAIVIAYQKSETFRKIVSTAFDIIKIGALTLARVAVTAFRFLVGMWLSGVEALVSGAAKAFGWVPGLGPKLQAAADNVKGFKDATNRTLSQVENKLDVEINTTKASIAARTFRDNVARPITIDVALRTRGTAGSISIAGVGTVNRGRLAGGGRVPGPWRGPTADNVLGISYAGVPTSWVNPREWVINVRSTDRMEREHPGALSYINTHGRLPGRADGGLVWAGSPQRVAAYRGIRPSDLAPVTGQTVQSGPLMHLGSGNKFYGFDLTEAAEKADSMRRQRQTMRPAQYSW